MAKKQLAQAQGQIKELQAKLEQHEQELKDKEQSLENERKALEKAEAEKNELRTSKTSLEKELSTTKTSVDTLQKDVASSSHKRKEVEVNLARVKEKAISLEAEVTLRDKKASSLLSEKKKIMEDLQMERKNFEKKERELEITSTMLNEANIAMKKKAERSAQPLIDIEIGGCEFAKAFPYFLTVQVGLLDQRRTDISAPSDRPTFASSSFLLPDEGTVTEIHIGAFCVIKPSADAEGVARELGTATINIDGASISEESVLRNINFVRKSGEKMLTVGRATVRVARRPMGDDAITPMIPLENAHIREPELDKSLWMAHPFQCRLRVLLHEASAIPALFGKSVANVVLRLLRFDGTISYENASLDVSLNAAEPLTVVSFNHEVVLPVKNTNLSEHRAQIVLQCSSPESSVTELLQLSFFLGALPFLHPVHLSAEPTPGRASSHARPMPSLAMTLTLEPMHHNVEQTKHGVEVRIDGIPIHRPLPDPISDAIIVICPNFDNSRTPKIPICVYNYDAKQDLSSCLEQHVEELRRSDVSQPFFITPVVDHSRTPHWNQFVVRFALESDKLKSISFFLFDKSSGRHDPASVISDVLVGFTALDLSVLYPRKEPLQRSFMLDLRLLEAPTAATSLEIDCRVWPLELSTGVDVLPKHVSFPSAILNSSPVADREAGKEIPENLAQLRNASTEFQLNHDLSVQLMKEFNLRANALKTAGQEIVELRRQVQLLTNENNKLKSQIEDEELVAAQIRRNPPNDLAMFDSLSSAELSLRLQTALQKYRDEKSRSHEMTQRLEAALKEIARGRGLQKHLDQLEKAHLEMAAALQKLQQENQKLDLYRKTAKSQEKVIAKLERVLEGSLEEVNKAQEVQIELERVKTENIRMREKCANLMARRKYEGDDNLLELEAVVQRKNEQIQRLQELIGEEKVPGTAKEKEQGNTRLSKSEPEGDSEEEIVDTGNQSDWQQKIDALEAEKREWQEKFEEMEDEKLDWEQRCSSMELRANSMEDQLVENSRHYGRELSNLKMTIVKKDALIRELELKLET